MWWLLAHALSSIISTMEHRSLKLKKGLSLLNISAFRLPVASWFCWASSSLNETQLPVANPYWFSSIFSVSPNACGSDVLLFLWVLQPLRHPINLASVRSKVYSFHCVKFLPSLYSLIHVINRWNCLITDLWNISMSCLYFSFNTALTEEPVGRINHKHRRWAFVCPAFELAALKIMAEKEPLFWLQSSTSITSQSFTKYDEKSQN